METALEAGAEDIREEDTTFEVITEPQALEAVKEALDAAAIKYNTAEVTMIPQTTLNLSGKEAEQMFRLMEMLEDCEDVQKLHTNAEIPDELMR
jgi:transcriptional/translational regulatory protein YebC/TACO1